MPIGCCARAARSSGGRELHFHVSPTLPHSHFAAINAVLIERRLRVADLVLSRATQPDRPWNGTSNVLFSRHLVGERDAATRGDGNLPSTILKTIAIFDVYGLVGPAVALTRKFHNVIATKIDPDALRNKLVLSSRIGALAGHLPHLGLGLWTHAKIWLGR